jgi:hypothetical protein
MNPDVLVELTADGVELLASLIGLLGEPLIVLRRAEIDMKLSHCSGEGHRCCSAPPEEFPLFNAGLALANKSLFKCRHAD